MPRTTRKVLLVPILAAAALLGTGCSSTVEGTAAPIGGSPASTDTGGGTGGVGRTDDPVAWMDQVCGALAPLAEAPPQPDFDPSASPDETFTQLRDQLTQIGGKMGDAVDALQAAGPSPIAGGDAFVQQMSENLNKARTTIDSTAQQLADVDPNNPEELFTALEGLGSAEGLEGLEDPGDALRSNPELDAAAEQAPKCQQLRASTGGGGTGG